MQDTILRAAKTPLTTPTPAERARQTGCPVCWAEPGEPCRDAGDLAGLHLGRYACARRGGLLTDAEAAAVITAAGDVFTPATVIIRDAADPAGAAQDAGGRLLRPGDRVHVEYEDSGTFLGPDGGNGLLVRVDDDGAVVSCARQQVRLLAYANPGGGS